MKLELLALSLCFPAVGLGIDNANHIFNAIHSTLRQWHSSVHHNGMSMFTATVAKGTHFYHGRSSQNIMSEVDWLAFEPEHAIGFARPSRSRSDAIANQVGYAGSHLASDDEADAEAESRYGYLHTYKVTKDLHLVYLDGMSAGKTEIGTLDFEDLIFFNGSISGGGRGWVGGGEALRASTLCDYAANKFGGRIDGLLRMEAGFEIIICNPLDNLEIVNIEAVERESNSQLFNGDSWAFLKAISSRYNDIGGSRVKLNYENFITAYNYSADLFNEDQILPRLKGVDESVLNTIRDAAISLIMAESGSNSGVDWRAATDMLVDRYGRILRYILNDCATLEEIQLTVEGVVSQFRDATDTDSSGTVTRCTEQVIPPSNDCLAKSALIDVAREVCESLVGIQEVRNFEEAVSIVGNLTEYLRWPMFKDCNPSCGDGEFCAIPMWPYGGKSFYESPRCRKYTEGFDADEESYWRAPPTTPVLVKQQ